jgi:hypothetical protein
VATTGEFGINAMGDSGIVGIIGNKASAEQDLLTSVAQSPYRLILLRLRPDLVNIIAKL